MRSLLFLFACVAAHGQMLLPIASGNQTTHNGFSSCMVATYDHTKVGNGTEDESSFGTLISLSDTTVKTVANGGKVTNSSGSDLLVFSDTGVTQVPSELEFYDGTNGIAILWANTNLSHTASGTLTVCAGNASPPARTAGVWDSNYKAIYHFKDGTTLSGNDSTTNANNGTLTNTPTAVTGIADGGMGTTLTGKYNRVIGYPAAGYVFPWTVSIWIKPSGTSGSQSFYGGAASGGNSQVNALEIRCNNSTNTVSVLHQQVTSDYTSTGTIGTSAFSQVAVTVDGSGNFTVYINGSVDGTYTLATVFSALQVETWIGGAGNADWFGGSIDESRTSVVKRSTGWISTEYQNIHAPGNIGSAGFWSYGAWF